MNKQMGLWIYSVIENSTPLQVEASGIHSDQRVFTVAHGDFAMVVSQEPMKKYALERSVLIAHQMVNETLMKQTPVLPVKFCTMAESQEQIIEQVLKRKERTEEFQRTLHYIRGKNEFGLRARWKNLDQVFANIGRENEKVKMTREKTLELQGEKQRMALIEVGHVVKEALEEKNKQTADALMQALVPYVTEFKKNNVIGDMNILNTAFLVEEKNQKQFDEAVNTVVARDEEKIQFKYVGPTPPFNFIEIVIRWDMEETRDQGLETGDFGKKRG